MTFTQAFRKFVRYYRPYRGLFYFDMLCALAVSAIDLAFPQILNFLTKGVFLRDPETVRNALWIIGIGLLVMYAVRYGCQYFITSWGHIMGARMESDMRQDLFNHYQRLSFTYYDRNNTGEMMSKLVSDLFDISELAHHGPENIVISTLKIIGAFAILIFMNVPMTLLLLAVTVVMMVRKSRFSKDKINPLSIKIKVYKARKDITPDTISDEIVFPCIFMGTTALGCSLMKTPRRSILKSMTIRITLIPPPVEEEDAPMSINSRSTILLKAGQRSKSVLKCPVVVMKALA